MQDTLISSLVINVGLLLFAAVLFSYLRPLRLLLQHSENSVWHQLGIAVIFGAMAMVSTIFGLEVQGAIANTRVISTVAAGLLGGPIAGIGAGLIGGIHRYLYHPDGFTSIACMIGTIFFGVIGAVAHRYSRNLSASNVFLVVLTTFAELCQAAILFAFARPFSAVLELEKAILIPKMVINSLGMVLFFGTLNRIIRSVTVELLEQRTMALYIAEQCLPYLREGLGNADNINVAAQLIRENTRGYHVAITDTGNIIAKTGNVCDDAYLLKCKDKALTTQETLVIEQEDSPISTQLASVIVAPLQFKDRAIGTLILLPLRFYPHDEIADSNFATGLAGFFSTMLELNRLDHEIELRHQAEFRAFQSQINPHFFYNALTTISALTRSDPAQARDLLLVLANYFRNILSINEEFVTLEAEMINVENYLTISRARFVDAIHCEMDLPADLTSCLLPPLIIQPLVENAVRHGYTAVDDRRVSIHIYPENNRMHFVISDQGHGFPQNILDALNDHNNKNYSGVFNVCKRLVSIYGEESRLIVNSTPQGSTVRFAIPLTPPTSSSQEVRT